jgi:small subunit ribosomal protein S12e
MSDAGDEIQVDAPAAEVEVTTEAPKGLLINQENNTL